MNERDFLLNQDRLLIIQPAENTNMEADAQNKWKFQAQQLVLEKRYSEAYKIYTEMLQTDPDNHEVLLDYGRSIIREYGDLELAAQVLERAAAVKPDCIETLLWLAEMYSTGYGKGYEFAAGLYHRVIELDPELPDAYIGLGMLHESPGNPVSREEAIAAFRRATQLAPERYDGHLNLGMTLIGAGEKLAARGELLRAARLMAEQGLHEAAERIRKTADALSRGEEIKSFIRLNASPRFNWPKK